MGIAENKEIIRELLSGWNDWTKGPTIDLLADDFTYEHRCNQETFPMLLKYQGKDEMIKHCLKMLEAFPDITRTPTRMVAEGNTVIVENYGTAHDPQGSEFKVETIDIFELRDGKVISQRQYSDTAYLMSWSHVGDFIRGPRADPPDGE
jgi:ketosteroid isomerase-like protein